MKAFIIEVILGERRIIVGRKIGASICTSTKAKEMDGRKTFDRI